MREWNGEIAMIDVDCAERECRADNAVNDASPYSAGHCPLCSYSSLNVIFVEIFVALFTIEIDDLVMAMVEREHRILLCKL